MTDFETNPVGTMAELAELKAGRDAALEQIIYWRERAVGAEGERDALSAHVERLNEYAKACANELAALIDKHNVQSDSDGSWLYDHQTPYELMQVVLSTPESSLARLKAEWQAETNWINAADELPECDEDDEKCVLCSDGHRVFEEFAHLVLWGLSTGEITHWMPLPAPPSQGGEKWWAEWQAEALDQLMPAICDWADRAEVRSLRDELRQQAEEDR